jgi:hypothetical protein
LHRPTTEVNARIATVEDLDEIVSERRAGVSATAEDLADDDGW